MEGCLSCPDQWGYVVRPNKAVVRAQNRDGELMEYHFEELGARCALHEIDHLDGKLFLEKRNETRIHGNAPFCGSCIAGALPCGA